LKFWYSPFSLQGSDIIQNTEHIS